MLVASLFVGHAWGWGAPCREGEGAGAREDSRQGTSGERDRCVTGEEESSVIDWRDRIVMAENESLDIGTEIQEGNLSRRNFLMAASFAGLGVFGGVRALGTLTGKTPIIADSKGVLFHEPERCVGCRRCELACTEFNDGEASAVSGARQGRPQPELRPGRRRCQRLLHRPGHLRQRQDHRRDLQAVPAPRTVRRGVPAGCHQGPPDHRRPQDRHGAVHRLRHLHGRLPVGHAHAQRGRPASRRKCFLCDGRPECARACPTGALTLRRVA